MTGHVTPEQFWSKVDILGDDECWRWKVGNSGGYGQVRFNGRNQGAHIVAWELANGRTVPDGLWILHSCDNHWCVNPKHLRPGTSSDNMQDMSDRGRGCDTRNIGYANGKAALTDDDVKLIRLLDRTGMNKQTLAQHFGVSPSQISRICNGKRWSHIPMDATPSCWY